MISEQERLMLLKRFFACWRSGLCELVDNAAVIVFQYPCLGLGLGLHDEGTRTPQQWPEYPFTPRARTMTPEQLWPDTDDGF